MRMTGRDYFFAVALTALLLVASPPAADCFCLVMMGTRRGKGNLKRRMEDDSAISNKVGSLNQGRGQEITGVSLPASGKIKGWEFGDGVRMACANVQGDFYAIKGECPRCGFDLWKGDIVNDDAFDDLPRISCPTW